MNIAILDIHHMNIVLLYTIRNTLGVPLSVQQLATYPSWNIFSLILWLRFYVLWVLNVLFYVPNVSLAELNVQIEEEKNHRLL